MRNLMNGVGHMTTKRIIDVDSEEYEDAPKGLRDAYKALRKEFDKTVTERDGARTQLASLSLADVLGKQGFKNPGRVQRDILRDGIDCSDQDAVADWLEENSDDYAKGEAAPAAAAPAQPPVPSAQQTGLEQITAAQSASTNPADMSKWETVQAQITDDMTPAQLLDLYAKNGI